jgi:hypothetical protein
MQPQTIEMRIERLETRVTEMEELLPARVDGLAERLEQRTTPVSRAATDVSISAIRLAPVLTALDELRSELCHEIRVGDEDTRRFMRDLHEDLIRRIAGLADARK